MNRIDNFKRYGGGILKFIIIILLIPIWILGSIFIGLLKASD